MSCIFVEKRVKFYTVFKVDISFKGKTVQFPNFLIKKYKISRSVLFGITDYLGGVGKKKERGK
jgi:hypothetical protein